MKAGATHQVIPFRIFLVVLIVLWSTARAVSLWQISSRKIGRSLRRASLRENLAWSHEGRQYFNTVLLC